MTHPAQYRWLPALVAAACALFTPSSAGAQLPNALAAGIGGVMEGRSELVVVGELGFGSLFLELEFGALSQAERCRLAAEPVDNCYDWMVGAGLRHWFRAGSTPMRPFVDVLGGSYNSGTGEEDTDFQYAYGALQIGGGVEVRQPNSPHGMRLSLNYRRVFADPDRDQLRFLATYVFDVLR